jgi:NADH:ubiquinone oxidoreductase subunit K
LTLVVVARSEVVVGLGLVEVDLGRVLSIHSNVFGEEIESYLGLTLVVVARSEVVVGLGLVEVDLAVLTAGFVDPEYIPRRHK